MASSWRSTTPGFRARRATITATSKPSNLFSSCRTVPSTGVVFTGNAELKTEFGSQVIHLHELLGFVQPPGAAVLDERQMAYGVGAD